jgi:FSR family fosmidomycin resistance protein-like MFS transporter
LYFVARGESLFIATALVSLWLGIGVLGQLGGGFISDRVGRRPVIAISLLIGAALFLGFVMTSGFLSLVLLVMAGAVLYASWSVIVVMSSEAAPHNVGAVSGLMLGFAVGIGGLAALGFGAIADKIGLQYALAGFSGFAFAAGLLALILPKARRVPTAL